MAHVPSPRDRSISWVDTLFSLPEATLLAGIIEQYEKSGKELLGATVSSLMIFANVSTRLPLTTSKLRSWPTSQGLLSRSDLGPTLHRLRSVGKRLFLLTNSEYYYTEAVMSYLLNDALPFYRSWSDYFDLVIVQGRKPNCFTKSEPFTLLDAEGDPVGEVTDLRRSAIYRGGNLKTLEQHLGHSGKEILYVGDHMYADILRSRKTATWSTAGRARDGG